VRSCCLIRFGTLKLLYKGHITVNILANEANGIRPLRRSVAVIAGAEVKGSFCCARCIIFWRWAIGVGAVAIPSFPAQTNRIIF
jgi:hypothetical protein